MHEKQRDFEQKLREEMAKKYPFNAKINEESMEKARSLRKRRNTVQPIEAPSEMLQTKPSAFPQPIDKASSRHSVLHVLDTLNHEAAAGNDIDAKLQAEL